MFAWEIIAVLNGWIVRPANNNSNLDTRFQSGVYVFNEWPQVIAHLDMKIGPTSNKEVINAS